MTELLSYNLESAICLIVLTLFYYLFLRKETFFGANRSFILFSMGYALLIPFLNINYGIQPENTADSSSLLNVAIANAETIKQNVATQLDPVVIHAKKPALNFNVFSVITGVYALGALAHLSLFGIRFTRLLNTIRKSNKKCEGKFYYVEMPNQSKQVYSFFNIIFIGSGLINTKDYKQIINHEKIHAGLYHSVDLILIELLIILQWFNPFIYLLRKMVVENHEYQTDSYVVRSSGNRERYLQLIFNRITNNQYFRITSSFSYSLSKKRLKMLTQERSSHHILKAKLVALVPVACLLFFLFACAQAPEKETITNYEKEKINFEQIGKEKGAVPQSLINLYRSKLDEKGEQIQYEFYSEFKGNKYPTTELELKKNTTYGFHLYNIAEDNSDGILQEDSRNYIELKDKSGNVLLTTKKTHKHGKKEQHIYLDLQSMETNNYKLSVKDSKYSTNKVVLVLSKATAVGNKTTPNDKNVYLKADEMPVYNEQGDISDFRNEIMQNLEYPEKAKKENSEGIVHVSFIVNKEGKITDKKIIKSASPSLDEAALAAFEGLKEWQPGKIDGKPVNIKYTIPVVFKSN